MAEPDFAHKSWDATAWSLWGLLYTGRASDTELRNSITQLYKQANRLLSQFGAQVDPMKSTLKEWREELASYARTIEYSEANDIVLRLDELLADVQQAHETERQLVKERKKLAAKSPPPSPESSDDEDDKEGGEWVMNNRGSALGHSRSTAKTPPKLIKKAAPPPSPEQLARPRWNDRQRQMGAQCDNTVNHGAHAVNQVSVLRHLHLTADDGSVRQRQEGPGNVHVRILVSDGGRQFWTLGLTHQELRDTGRFSVYRRIGNRDKFDFVAGQHLPDEAPA